MSKKNNKNGRPYNPQLKTSENPTEEVSLNETTELEKMTDDALDMETPNVIENNIEEPVDELITKAEDHTSDANDSKTNEKVNDVKPVYNDIKQENTYTPKEKTNDVFKIVFVKNGSPLQISKILNRLKVLSIDYEYDRESSTITGHSFNTLDMAIREKKYLAGKGLKPMIFEGSVKRI